MNENNGNTTNDDRIFSMVQVVAAIKQGQDDLHARLFVEGGGILPTMYAKLTAMEKEMNAKASAADLNALIGTVAIKANSADITAMKDTISSMKEKRAYHIGYAAGAGSIATLVLKYVASKVGVHF